MASWLIMREYFEGVYWCGHSVLMTCSPFMEVARCNILGNRLKKNIYISRGDPRRKEKRELEEILYFGSQYHAYGCHLIFIFI